MLTFTTGMDLEKLSLNQATVRTRDAITQKFFLTSDVFMSLSALLPRVHRRTELLPLLFNAAGGEWAGGVLP